jgi:cytochrome c-type biogenesis protein CcmH/NrfG
VGYPENELRIALQAADRHDVNTALETWRDVLMDQLQSPQYDTVGATDQANEILSTIRQTGNLMPFRAFLQEQVTSVPEELPDWRILGLLYNMQGEYQMAARTWRHVTETPGAGSEDWYQFAKARAADGDAAGARAAFAVALKGLPENSAHRIDAQQALATLR